MLKVAIVTPTISHFEVPLFRLAASMEGLDVHVFHNDLRDNAFVDADYGTTIHWGEQLKAGYANTGFAKVADLKAALIDWSPDVALQYGYAWKGALQVFIQLKRLGIPVVHRGTLSHFRDPRLKGLAPALRRALRPLVLKLFDAHHYGGQYSERVLSNALVTRDRRYFVPYSVDSQHFAEKGSDASLLSEAAAIRSRLGWQKDDPVVMQIGQLIWVKGADLIVDIIERAQSRIPNIKLLVVGAGPLLEDCVAAATKRLARGSFEFTGFVPSKAPVPFYLASTLVMFPSRYETWARAANEAMLCRRCCFVAKGVAAAGGLIEHGENGYVVDPLEPGPFVARIEEFLSLPPERRAEMGEAARKRALFFSYEAHADELRRSFVETAERAGRNRARPHA